MPTSGTHPIHTAKAIQDDYSGQVHTVSYNLAYDTVASGAEIKMGRIGPGVVTDVKVIKKTDFNAGTSAVIDVGLNYPSSTTDDPDGLVDGHDLSGSTALGLIRGTMKDTAIAYVEEPADVVLTPAYSGAQTTGECKVVVEWIPDSAIGNT